MELNQLPFVSICTPTFNRRPFIPYIIKCFNNQTYPKDRMEWIVIDDGFDPVGELFANVPQVKYYRYDEHMTLGKKRNLMHSKCSGDIIVYMDDDDYYPPERVSHAVQMLTNNPNVLIAGSSEMHIYFDSLKSIVQFGPYGNNHATAATFAFKKELLIVTGYDETSLFAEERQFLKDYSIPFVQLDTQKTILVFSHKHNSVNKDKMLENPEFVKATPSRFVVSDYIKDLELLQFYVNDMNNILVDYDSGDPKYKPKILEELKKSQEKQEIAITINNRLNEIRTKYAGQNITLNMIIMDYEELLNNKNFIISELMKKISSQTQENNNLKELNSRLMTTIKSKSNNK